jgi:hypothetical protein
MTDLQFKSILELVNQILDRSNDLEDAKRALKTVMGKQDSLTSSEKDEND